LANVTIRRRADSVAVTRGQLGLTDDPADLIVGGQVIELPTEIAGQPPFWRVLDDGEPQVRFKEYRQRAGKTEVRELGSGLLSQEGNWEPVNPKRYSGRTNDTPEA
jgi:hypothetical protein